MATCLSAPGLVDGKIKQNQDSYFCISHVFGNLEWSAFGVFDGHGEDGKSD